MSDVRAETYIDKSKREIYDHLTGDVDSIFYNRKDVDVFVAAAAIGFYFRKKEPIRGTKHSLFPMNLYSSDNPNLWMLKSIAIATDGIDVLRNLKDVATIVGEYANAGIDILYERSKNPDELDSMTYELLEIIDQEGIQ